MLFASFRVLFPLALAIALFCGASSPGGPWERILLARSVAFSLSLSLSLSLSFCACFLVLLSSLLFFVFSCLQPDHSSTLRLDLDPQSHVLAGARVGAGSSHDGKQHYAAPLKAVSLLKQEVHWHWQMVLPCRGSWTSRSTKSATGSTVSRQCRCISSSRSPVAVVAVRSSCPQADSTHAWPMEDIGTITSASPHGFAMLHARTSDVEN